MYPVCDSRINDIGYGSNSDSLYMNEYNLGNTLVVDIEVK